jgi:hypothetical protein
LPDWQDLRRAVDQLHRVPAGGANSMRVIAFVWATPFTE